MEGGWSCVEGEDGHFLRRASHMNGYVLRREDGYMLWREDGHVLRRVDGRVLRGRMVMY